MIILAGLNATELEQVSVISRHRSPFLAVKIALKLQIGSIVSLSFESNPNPQMAVNMNFMAKLGRTGTSGNAAVRTGVQRRVRFWVVPASLPAMTYLRRPLSSPQTNANLG